jgi:uncharacterized membrane protein (DUF4010 family)
MIVLPLTPNQPQSWLGGVNPFTVWQLVVVLMLVQSAGHVALRLFGPRLGLPLSGLVSGFVSSTATVAAMGARAKQQPALTMACVCGALLSTVSTSLQIALISLVIQPSLLRIVAPALGCALIASLVVSAAAFRRSELPHESLPDRPAFSLRQSIGLALLLSAASAVVAWAQATYGQSGLYLTAAIAGLADAHAGVAAVMSLIAQDASQSAVLLPAMLLTFTSNTVSKIVMAYVAGGWRFGSWVTGGLVAVAVAIWMPFLLQNL